MDKLFNANAVAIVGASRESQKIGHQILANVINSGYSGKIYPINPKAEQILNLNCFKTVLDVPGQIDLAIVAVPAPLVEEVLLQCAKKQIPFAVIISAGFAEEGANGKKLQDQIAEKILKNYPIRLIGPNCLGVFNTENKLNLTFAKPKVTKGSIGMILQSGALGVALMDLANEYDLGFSKFISMGNKLDLNENDLIEYLAQDEQTKVIALYLENIVNEQKFLQVCSKASKIKPIVVLKGGLTETGAAAAFSHTAAIATESSITKALFKQANLIFADTIEEMLNILMILNAEPPLKNNALAIITNAGGPAILASDKTEAAKLHLPNLNQKLSKVKKILLPNAQIANPIDLTGEAQSEHYQKALQEVVKLNEISAVLVILTPQTSTQVIETAEVLAGFSNSQKPIVAAFIGDESVNHGVNILKKYAVPHFQDPALAVESLGKIAQYFKKEIKNTTLLDLAPQEENSYVFSDPLELVSCYNIPTPPSGMATNFDVALKIVKRIGFPVAVKNIGKFGEHKFKAGKVILNVPDETYFKMAVQKVGFPIMAQKMVNAPFEVIFGAKRHLDNFVITFGWGGVEVEEINDIALRIWPLSEGDLDEMIEETKIGRLLIQNGTNLSLIKNILLEVCQIMLDFPSIEELDLNPVLVDKKSAVCVDARYKLDK